jgi:lactoylglutathione lyase
MQFAYTILYVESVTATLDFYVNAFGLKQKFLHESGDYGELDTGTTVLAFSARSLMRQLGKHPSAADAQAPCFEIALATDNVPAALLRAIACGGKPISDAKEMPWGQTVGYVADINGFLIEICTPMGS